MNQKKKRPPKQIAALVGVIVLVLMYIITLIVAIVDTSASGKMFGICIAATFFVPILTWIYIWMYGKLTGKSTMADLNLGGEDHVSDEELREILIKQATEAEDDNDTEETAE